MTSRVALVRTLLAGFVAAVALSALGLLLRLLAGVAFPPQALFDLATQFLGTPAMFQFLHATFGYGQGGKVAAFVSVALIWIGGLSLLRLVGPLFGTVVLFMIVAVLIPLPFAALYAALYAGLYFALASLERSSRTLEPVARESTDTQPLEPQSTNAEPSTLEPVELGIHEPVARRDALKLLAGGSAVLLGIGSVPLVRNVLAGDEQPTSAAWQPSGPLPLGILTQDELYYISKNIEAFDPNLSESDWRLELRGLVKNPRSLSLVDLKSLPRVTSERTLVCISNPVGGALIGNVVWGGVRVRDLLQSAGVQPGARWVIWRSSDGYVESLPLAAALEQDVLLAFEINGEPLTRRHGFPLRVLIPDRLGMKQPKWITAIELSTTEIPGYWAERGWSRTGRIETMSRIDEPRQGRVLQAGKITQIRGVAFAGTRPISRVEVSTDGGQSWLEAQLRARRNAHTWTLWSLMWTPTPGPQRLMVRAYANNDQQVSSERPPLPEAATGWHTVELVAS
jgi:DMSO/TMAO reductase YedYZ molybdopterin-dependent catalytic subunit